MVGGEGGVEVGIVGFQLDFVVGVQGVVFIVEFDLVQFDYVVVYDNVYDVIFELDVLVEFGYGQVVVIDGFGQVWLCQCVVGIEVGGQFVVEVYLWIDQVVYVFEFWYIEIGFQVEW